MHKLIMYAKITILSLYNKRRYNQFIQQQSLKGTINRQKATRPER